MTHNSIISVKRKKFRWAEERPLPNGDIGRFFSCSQPQMDILANNKKYIFGLAGSGGGKSCLLPLWIFLKLANHRETHIDFWRALIVSPSVPTFESSQLKQHLLSIFDNTEFHGEWSEQHKTYTGKGYEIVCRTAENDPRRLSGGQYDAIACDEAWQISNDEIWEELRRRSNIKNAQVLVITTPNIENFVYDAYQEWEKGNTDYYFRQWATIENPIKTPEQHDIFLSKERIKLGQARFERMYQGKFSRLTGLVFDAFSDPKSIEYPVITTLPSLPSPAVRAFGSVDWGETDAFASYIFVHCENDIVYIVEELYGSKLPLETLVYKLKQMQDRWSNKTNSKYAEILKGGLFDHFYCDKSRPEILRLFARRGLSLTNNKVTNVDAGISIMDQLFRCNRIKIFDCCTNLIRECKGYTYNKNGSLKDKDNHGVDSARYGLGSYFSIRTINPLAPLLVEENPIEVAKRLGQVISNDDLQQKAIKAEKDHYQQWFQQKLNED